jgi:polysaccharide pyruvyl transferase WcaK-like protein
MKVLVINEGYSDNLGDQAINDSLQYLLNINEIKDIDFQDFTKNIDQPIPIKLNEVQNAKFRIKSIMKYLIPVKIRWLLKNLRRIIKASKNNYDLVIIGGGQLILSNATFSTAMFLWIFFLRLFGNKNIVLFAIGSGSRFSLIDKLLYKIALKKVSNIYMRDKKSQKIIKHNFNINSNFVYDVAFIHNKITQNVNSVKENILLGVISFDVYNRYNKGISSKEDFFESWIKLLKDNHINIKDVKLFYTTQDDGLALLEFKNYISQEYQIKLEVLETNTKDKLIDELNKSKLVISARMHALILGLTYKCKIITYPISNKLIEFDNMFNNDFNLETIQNNIKLKVKDIKK